MAGFWVGIDLGTTFSSVCLYTPAGRQEFVTITNSTNIPSVVSAPVNPEESYNVGFSAVKNRNTLVETKRLIGMKCENKNIQQLLRMQREDRPHFEGFKIDDNDPNGRVRIAYEKRGVRVVKEPWKISAKILKYLKEYALK